MTRFSRDMSTSPNVGTVGHVDWGKHPLSASLERVRACSVPTPESFDAMHRKQLSQAIRDMLYSCAKDVTDTVNKP